MGVQVPTIVVAIEKNPWSNKFSNIYTCKENVYHSDSIEEIAKNVALNRYFYHWHK